MCWNFENICYKVLSLISHHCNCFVFLQCCEMQLSLLLCRLVGAVSYQFNFVGAMENWGLITYRETCLLVDPENTSTVQKQWIALTVGHEIAHQWFGNLVTMVRSCMLRMLW
jgi:hypothetical protein